ncbi:MAG: 23S rRNA (uracil(1939)-C(5))-methyltransferase RlmD [Lachnospiraceae bacterium]|nr:23S rRNA (uracil(1939)-C(5))-methyltransferase RlmD [Lachnospiraceae bacterium]
MKFQKDNIITIVIDDMGVDGEGIGKIDGFTFFVKDAVIGDEVEAKIMKVKKGYAYARLMKIVTPSPKRTEPRCPYHRQCGGCQIQALDYKCQLLFKENKVKNNLNRIGGFPMELLDQCMEPIVGMEDAYHYRNKAQFPVGTDKNGETITGFYAGRTHVIIPNMDCALGVQENKEILECILGFMRKYKIAPYSESSGEGLVRHILIRKGFSSGEIMVCVVLNSERLPHSDKLVEMLCRIKGMTSISININKEKTNVIMGGTCRTLWGTDTITDVIHFRNKDRISLGEDHYTADDGITFAISPLSFYQVNPIQTEKLYSLVLDYAGLTGSETVWDLYCGIGTISLFMAKRAGQVHGIEIVDQAIIDAWENAKRNKIDNVRFYVGKVEEVLPALYEREGIHADVICVDPPRKGCDTSCLETIVKMSPKRIVYVSCDSATLARDLKYLCGYGYELRCVRAVDMFPQTVHVETVVKLSLKKDTPKIEVTMEPSAESNYTPTEKATYGKIKEYVKEKHGLNVSSLYIGQIKEKCGLDKRDNYNLPKSENAKVPKCPPDKEAAIMDAFRHFGMI